MEYKKFIFDVGANEGFDGLGLALKNSNYYVHAFEPNPELLNKIILLKKKIESRIGKKIENYQVHLLAISNKNEISNFNISKNDRVSSLLNLSENLDEAWPGYRNNHFKVVKTILVKVITLEKFLNDNKINSIDYLHIDTQGNDLRVLQGIGSKIKLLGTGVMEAAINIEKSAYKNNHTLEEVKNFLKKNNLEIKHINYVEHQSNLDILKNEVNITFYNPNKKVKLKTKYNVRYFQRVLNEKTSIKDDLRDALLKIINNFKHFIYN